MALSSEYLRVPTSFVKRRLNACKAFTLVEVLVVLGIIGILAAVSLPAVVGMSKASRGTSGVSIVMSTLDQARNLAISQATPSYLVMATADTAWPKEYRGRVFALFSESYNPVTEKYEVFAASKWEKLPQGVCFKPATDTIFGSPESTGTKFYFGPASRELPVAKIKFTTTGSIESPTETAYARIRLFEGFFDDAGTPVSTNPAGAAGEYNIRLVLLTGRGMREEALRTP